MGALRRLSIAGWRWPGLLAALTCVLPGVAQPVTVLRLAPGGLTQSTSGRVPDEPAPRALAADDPELLALLRAPRSEPPRRRLSYGRLGGYELGPRGRGIELAEGAEELGLGGRRGAPEGVGLVDGGWDDGFGGGFGGQDEAAVQRSGFEDGEQLEAVAVEIAPDGQGAYPSHQGAYPSHQGAYPSHQGAYPSQPSHLVQAGYGRRPEVAAATLLADGTLLQAEPPLEGPRGYRDSGWVTAHVVGGGEVTFERETVAPHSSHTRLGDGAHRLGGSSSEHAASLEQRSSEHGLDFISGVSPMEQDAVAPQQDVVAPQQDVVAPQQDAVAPQQDVVAPQQDAVAPQQDAVAPQQDVVAPQLPGHRDDDAPASNGGEQEAEAAGPGQVPPIEVSDGPVDPAQPPTAVEALLMDRFQDEVSPLRASKDHLEAIVTGKVLGHLKCVPKCTWACDKPLCNQHCEANCTLPTCRTRCSEGSVSGCHVRCDEPRCSVICNNDTGACRTKCAEPRCGLVCPDMPSCVNECHEPRCQWTCTSPTLCPEPKCRMACQAPEECASSRLFSELPQLRPGEASVHSFRPPHRLSRVPRATTLMVPVVRAERHEEGSKDVALNRRLVQLPLV